MHPLLTVSYWFNIHSIPFHPLVERALLVVFAAFTIVGVASSLMMMKRGFTKETRRAFGKLGSHLTWTGLFGLLLWTFSYQGIPVLSMKFFYILWFGWVLWGFYSLYKYVYVEVREKDQLRKEREEAEKWLPKKK